MSVLHSQLILLQVFQFFMDDAFHNIRKGEHSNRLTSCIFSMGKSIIFTQNTSIEQNRAQPHLLLYIMIFQQADFLYLFNGVKSIIFAQNTSIERNREQPRLLLYIMIVLTMVY